MQRRIRLGELLIRAGLITELQLKAALAEQRRWGGRLGRILVDMNFISEDMLVKGLARLLDVKRADLDRMDTPPDVLQRFDPVDCQNRGYLPIHFNAAEKPLWTETAAQDQFIDLWMDLSSALHEYPTDKVAYELMNEPVADDPADWNKVLARAFAAVREREPQRTMVIGSNRWQSADTFDELVVPDDDHIILSFHFYEPFLLTHDAAPWTAFKNYTGPVHYPGVILSQAEFDALTEDQQAIASDWVGREFNRQILLSMMEKPLRRAKELNLPLYCGEYGVYMAAPMPDRLRWYRDMLAIFDENNISSANWNYKSDEFGLVGLDGQPIEAIRDVLTGNEALAPNKDH